MCYNDPMNRIPSTRTATTRQKIGAWLCLLLLVLSLGGGRWYCPDGTLCGTCTEAPTQTEAQHLGTDACCSARAENHDCRDCCTFIERAPVRLVSVEPFGSMMEWSAALPIMAEMPSVPQGQMLHITPYPAHAPPGVRIALASPRAPPAFL
jgi:hypothetical protein